MQRKTSPGPAEPGGTGGPLARPEFPRLNKVRLSKRARDDQCLVLLAPEIFSPSAGSAVKDLF